MYHPTNLQHVADANETAGEVNPLHEADEQRNREWQAFERTLVGWARRESWPAVVKWTSAIMRRGASETDRDELLVQDFVDDYGWAGFFRALARALES